MVNSYSRKFKTLNVKFVADVVGEGGNGTKGKFETTQQQFLQGHVLTMCAGWFGEINEDFEKIIKILARELAAGEDGVNVSSSVDTDRKGGSSQIMLQQFRRAFGVAIVRANVSHKLGRLQYVRVTP